MFAHRLALELGVWDVQAMLRGMDSTQWNDWVAYYEEQPFGDERADLRVAQLCALTANVNRMKGQKAYRPKDFMLDFAKPVPQSANSMKAVLSSFTQVFRAHQAAGGSDGISK